MEASFRAIAAGGGGLGGAYEAEVSLELGLQDLTMMTMAMDLGVAFGVDRWVDG